MKGKNKKKQFARHVQQKQKRPKFQVTTLKLWLAK